MFFLQFKKLQYANIWLYKAGQKPFNIQIVFCSPMVREKWSVFNTRQNTQTSVSAQIFQKGLNESLFLWQTAKPTPMQINMTKVINSSRSLMHKDTQSDVLMIQWKHKHRLKKKESWRNLYNSTINQSNHNYKHMAKCVRSMSSTSHIVSLVYGGHHNNKPSDTQWWNSTNYNQ